MKMKISFAISAGVIVTTFLIFVVFYGNYVQDREQKRVNSHSKVIASAMWDFEAEGMMEYLRLACRAYKYGRIMVSQDSGEIFIDLEHSFQKPIDRFLISLNLVPRANIISDVVYNEKVIGQITVTWYNTAVYIYSYALILVFLLVAVQWYYLRTLTAKRELEARVIERTTDLREEITERIQAEEALRESEVRFKDLASFLPLSLFETDDQGNITFANTFAFESTGYTQKDIDNGLHMLQVIHPDDHDKVLTKSIQVMQGVLTDGSEYLVQRKDRSTFPAFINTNPTLKDNKPIGLKGYIFDLTERKKAEEALRESEERLARSKKMESLGLLAGGVAHDLNNVLSGIVSYPELLLLDLPEDSKLRKPIETMQESGHRAAAIVMDLLTVARGVAISKEPLNLNDLVSDYLNSPEFKKLKQFHPTIIIKSNLDSNLFNIAGSHVHIRKMVMNLLSNAAEAITGSGNVTISTGNRYIDKPLKGYDDVAIGEYVVLTVSDNGSGISPGDLERIFEPFYTKKIMGRSGTGLGLAVVWNVVQDHEGYIDVKSDPNSTSVELYFPITRDEIAEKPLSIPIKDFKGNGEAILVVDDVESQRGISCKMLDVLGYKTEAVSSGEEAIEYLEKNTMDLVLLDMIMDPGINGRETYERIIEIRPKQKAIIISGFADSDEVKEAQKLGAGKYIKKPLTLESLGLAVIEELKK